MSIKSTTREERMEMLGEPAGEDCPDCDDGELYRIPGLNEDMPNGELQFSCPNCTSSTYLNLDE